MLCIPWIIRLLIYELGDSAVADPMHAERAADDLRTPVGGSRAESVCYNWIGVPGQQDSLWKRLLEYNVPPDCWCAESRFPRFDLSLVLPFFSFHRSLALRVAAIPFSQTETEGHLPSH